MTYATIKAELPRLTKPELIELRKRIDALLGFVSPETSTKDWLTVGIWVELRRRGLVPRRWVERMIKAASPKDYGERCAVVRKLLLKTCRARLNEVEQHALGMIAGHELAEYLKHHEHFGLRDCLYNIDRVPEALDNAFPGYLEAGLLGWLISDRQRYLPGE